MVEFALVDYFVVVESIGMVATLIVSFYYQRQQMQKLSVDMKTKVLNDLDDKLLGLAELAIERPPLEEVLDMEN
jgi:hypothetical protein